MQPFDFQLRTRVVSGEDSIDQIGDLTKAAGYSRALLVSDPGIVLAGHVQRGIDALKKVGVETQVFDGAQENPTTDNIEAGLAVANDYRPDVLIGLGGGSSMDCAKGINFVYSCGGKMEDYWGVGKATGPMLPLIAVPTTAGTGSEMQSFALISQSQTHTKMACGDKKAAALIAILDPKLTLTQPPIVSALTGIDAISHAVETAVTTKRNEVSALFSTRSFQLLANHFPDVILHGGDLEARAAVQLGAAYAGVAIENSMLGAAHALANPLTATYGTPHGQAVGVMLPHVVAFNAARDSNCDHIYRSMLECTAHTIAKGGNAGAAMADLLRGYCEHSGLETRLSDIGINETALPELAAAAAKEWTATFNPVPVDEATLLGIYQAAF